MLNYGIVLWEILIPTSRPGYLRIIEMFTGLAFSLQANERSRDPGVVEVEYRKYLHE